MYTRSYRSSSYPHTRALPPDYGGTALVIAQPEPEPTEHVQAEPRFSDRRQKQPPLPEDNRPTIRRETSVRTKPPAVCDSMIPPPFGGQGQPPLRSDPIIAAPTSVPPDADDIGIPEETNRLGRLFDPANLKSDDLLLLGLILLFLSEGEENGRDALLLLTALYVSGL